MPYEMSWEPHGLYNLYYGSFSLDDIKSAQSAMYGDARFDSLHYIINDYSGGTPDDSIDESIVQICAATAWGATQSNPRLRFALIASEPRTRALLEAIAAIPVAADIPYRVFHTLAEARAWIASGAPARSGPRPA